MEIKRRQALAHLLAESIRQRLEMIQPLRTELKRRAMIYQCAEKEYVALAQGKKFNAYHKYSYERWSKVRDAFNKAQRTGNATPCHNGGKGSSVRTRKGRGDLPPQAGRKGAGVRRRGRV